MSGLLLKVGLFCVAITKAICSAYGMHTEDIISQLTNFSFNHFIESLRKGYSLKESNEILGGLTAHAMVGFSDKFKNEIEVKVG